MRPDEALVADVLIYAQRALRHVRGLTFEDFGTDETRQDAALHAIQIVGEAAWNVSDEYQERHPEVAWARIAGIRHRLAHHYGQVRLDIVWTVLRHDVPELIRLLGPLVAPEEPSPPPGT